MLSRIMNLKYDIFWENVSYQNPWICKLSQQRSATSSSILAVFSMSHVFLCLKRGWKLNCLKRPSWRKLAGFDFCAFFFHQKGEFQILKSFVQLLVYQTGRENVHCVLSTFLPFRDFRGRFWISCCTDAWSTFAWVSAPRGFSGHTFRWMFAVLWKQPAVCFLRMFCGGAVCSCGLVLLKLIRMHDNVCRSQPSTWGQVRE